LKAYYANAGTRAVSNETREKLREALRRYHQNPE
jgi:hypothetical protein